MHYISLKMHLPTNNNVPRDCSGPVVVVVLYVKQDAQLSQRDRVQGVLVLVVRYVLRLTRYERISIENRRFRSNMASLTQNFR